MLLSGPLDKKSKIRKVKEVLTMLVNDFAYSTQSNYRRGGLIGLASCALALKQGTKNYLEILLPPILQ